MSDDQWRQRLAAALKESGKSMRSVSLASGNGPGYVHSILEDGKDPKIGNLLDVCAAVPVSPIYILYGLNVSPEDHAILEALQRNPRARAGILALISATTDES